MGYDWCMPRTFAARHRQSLLSRHRAAMGFALHFGLFALALAPAASAGYDIREMPAFSSLVVFLTAAQFVFSATVRVRLSFFWKVPRKRALSRLARLPAVTLAPRLLPVPPRP